MEKDVDKKILKAALEVVANEKISGTRMHIIAKEANMSQANLHYHFSTKNDILVGLLESIQEEFSKGRMHYIDGKNKSMDDNIKGFFSQKKDDILINKKMEYAQMDYWVQSTVNEEMREIFKKTFNIWRENIKDVLPKDNESIGSTSSGEYYSQIDGECNNKPEKARDEEKARRRTQDNIPYIMVSLMLGASLQYLIDEGKFDLDDYFKVAEDLILNQYDGYENKK